uniref:Uncharacterized protein n=1 Tax=Oryza nivara TaxID=4536 RepID=A0A0E0HC52_ORYNI
MCAFCLLCQHNVERFGAYDGVADDNAPVVVPGLARRIEVTRAQAPGFFCIPGWDKFANDVERRYLFEMDRCQANTTKYRQSFLKSQKVHGEQAAKLQVCYRRQGCTVMPVVNSYRAHLSSSVTCQHLPQVKKPEAPYWSQPLTTS